MDQIAQEKIGEIKQINYGAFLYFVLFSAVIYFINNNWFYAVCFAILLTNCLGCLCENKLAKSLGYFVSVMIGFFWITFNQLLCEKIFQAIRREIYYKQTEEFAIKCFSYKMGAEIPVVNAIVFSIGLVIFTVLIQKFVSQLPASWKLSKRLQLIVVFSVNFARLLLSAIVFSAIAYWGLEKIQFSASWIVWGILLLPWFFCYKTWKDSEKNVNEFNSENNSADGNKVISAITIPNLTLADVAGMNDVKEEIYQRMILPLKKPDTAKKYGVEAGGGMLLYGPPGTGKTYFAKAVAGELKVPFYAITAADIFSKYVGESEQNVRNIFQELRKNKLSVLFIDELESIFRSRADDIHETTRKIILVLLQELDGISSNNSGMLLIGATNAPHLIDEAFLRAGRFDVKIFVGLPDAEARKQIIEANFSDLKLPFEEGLIDALVECTEDFSGADLKGLVQKVKRKAFATNAKICDCALVQDCLSDVYPSSNVDLMSAIRQWEALFKD